METQMKPRLGISILEVLVALIILAVVLPGLAGMVVSSRKAQNANIHMDQAYAYGLLLMDSLSLSPTWALEPNSTTSNTIAGKTYNAAIKVDVAAGLANIRISWSQGGLIHSIAMTEALSSTGAYR
ncbi:MAG: hypothetical protein RL318_2357 [Fibrobacterota bacterium]|jgi:Tfp pilus assembly protein PilV